MRPLIYGNGTLLVCADERGVVRDFYYPYAGMENHGGYMRLGLFDTDTRAFSWLEYESVSQRYLGPSSPIGETVYESGPMGARVTVKGMVHHEQDAFMRSITVANASAVTKRFRLFSSQNYHILENNYANTAVRDGPMLNHYKRDRFFIQSSMPMFDRFTTGISEWRGMEGTWKDAEDGELAGNIVAHGTVDSTIGWTLPGLEPGASSTIHFWVCVARNFRDAKKIDDWIRARNVEAIYHANDRFWQSFCARGQDKFAGLGSLPPVVRDAFARSLLAITCHLDRGGSIIASCDSQIKQQGADYYTYCWPRDAAWVAIALDKAGYGDLCKHTYRFFKRTIDPRGYFRHKYTPAGDLGSTWHPLPMIQVDETATPIYAVYRHWLEHKDALFLSELYEPFIKPAADFLMRFLENDLPKPSFDLWEERKGVYTYSCASVYAGLDGASAIAMALGDDESAGQWSDAATRVRKATIERLYDRSQGRFKRGLDDDTVDASEFAAWYMGMVPAGDPKAVGTMKAMERDLMRPVGGVARYTGDGYQGYMNAWPICTLWLAQWYIKMRDFDRALALIEWAARHASASGLMPEQVGAQNEPLSVMPLTWSHSTFVLTVIELMELKTC